VKLGKRFLICFSVARWKVVKVENGSHFLIRRLTVSDKGFSFARFLVGQNLKALQKRWKMAFLRFSWPTKYQVRLIGFTGSQFKWCAD
jgi:hypothetical protein